ncbi:DapH/DapD/GlmU-related protein [Emticicia sp. TH156]|uniref:acyltransferase n=1 Tax=Emticicia sp. TH156 TaxID=2067454 RepID=UPI000C759F71|nr:acyltransferase [Emticicia sp. TH156]PLK44031.1 acyltransferase [Emticicia sp. TH156]
MLNKILILAFKSIRELKYHIWPPITTLFTKILLKLNGAKFSSVHSSGIPVIHISRNGVFEAGKNFVLGNSRDSYVSGLQGKCKIEVRNGAVLRIGNSVGLTLTTIICHEQITIEDNVNIGVGVHVFDTDFHSLNHEFRRDSKLDRENKKTKPILIKNDVFIGAHSIILKGVTIGENSVIGAGSVVTKSIPANVIAAGNPCRVIRELI